MQKYPYLTQRIVTILSIATLSACSGAPSIPGAVQDGRQNRTAGQLPVAVPRLGPRKRTAVSPQYNVSAPLLYVTNFNPGYNDVAIYRAKAKDPSPITTITDGISMPTGDCLDAEGTLYVANEPVSSLGWVSEYPLGQTQVSKTITNGMNTPAFCAIDSSGNLWVTNIGGNVTEYKKGSTNPGKVITNGVPDPVGIAFDHSGNMYVANGLGGGGPVINVVVYAPGGTSPSRTITDHVRSPAGIAVDANGTLYVTNVRQNNVEKFRAGKSHPYQAITNGMNFPVAATVGKNGWLYVTNDGSNPNIVEFSPGSITPSNREITKGLATPEGSAFFPPLLP